ncbi:hypothetical protein FRC11_007454 [Ceratobasidium sp. 423]|nr:hypothetical protein FRC11_007454 [Ceratobasidium sp. 423]
MGSRGQEEKFEDTPETSESTLSQPSSSESDSENELETQDPIPDKITYEEFEDLLKARHPTKSQVSYYNNFSHQAELWSNARRFLTTRCGLEDLTDKIHSAERTPIRQGGSADIFRARIDNIGHVAVKFYRQNELSGPSDFDAARDVLSRAYRWKNCGHHRNIHELLGLTMFQDGIGLVLSWASNGNVREYLRITPNADRLHLCVQICEGVSYLHRVGMVHGDIKGANVLVTEDGTAKLTDFDYARLGGNSLIALTEDSGFTPRWGAPELLQDVPPKLAYASDVYSLGMIIIEVVTTRQPWDHLHRDQSVVGALFRGQIPRRPSEIPEIRGDGLWSLLGGCWRLEPAERPSAGSVLSMMKALPPNSIDPLENHSGSRSAPQSRMSSFVPTTMREVTSLLTAHGCRDISEAADEPTFGQEPSFTGGSSNSFRGKLLDSTEVCVKVPRRSGQRSEDAENRVYISREIHTWSKCNHPNILPFLGMAIFRDELASVSPYMKSGTLRPFLERNPNADRCRLSTQICEGLAYLHSIDVVHGDLKGDNVFISDDGAALIADFGSADLEDRGIEFTLFMNRCGHTMRWAAPELIKYGFFRCKEADVYSVGMTILETFTGEVPFKGKQNYTVIAAITKRRQIPTRPTAQIPERSKHGDTLWDLLCECWSRDMEKRPSAADVVDVMKTITTDGLV